MKQTFASCSANETRQLGALLARTARHSLVVALHGDLGAGKTTFVQGMAAGLAIDQPVTSPTFTLVNEYAAAGVRLVHVDVYRLPAGRDTAALEAETLGLEEILSEDDAVVAIEWAERVEPILPKDHLVVEIAQAVGDDRRAVHMIATGPRSAGVLGKLASAWARRPESCA